MGGGGASHKLGPREIGTVHGWKGYKYEENNGKKATKKELTQQEKQQLIKQGPRDIGTTHGWRGLQFDNSYIEKLRLKKQRRRELQKLKALEAEKKKKSEFDPRNISKPKDWKGLKY